MRCRFGLLLFGLLLLAGCGSSDVSDAELRGFCRSIEEPGLSSATRGDYERELSRVYGDDWDKRINLLDRMRAECPEVSERFADIVESEQSGSTGGDAGPSEPPFTCEERYAMSQNNMFTEEEQRSLREAVDVDCLPR